MRITITLGKQLSQLVYEYFKAYEVVYGHRPASMSGAMRDCLWTGVFAELKVLRAMAGDKRQLPRRR